MSQIKLQSTEEGIWIKIPRTYPNADQQKILKDHLANKIEKTAINDLINEANRVSVDDIMIAVNKFNEIKPVGDYKLIASQVVIEDSNIVSGFINYKLDGTINKIEF